MILRHFWFIAWLMFIVLMFAASTFSAWSPTSEGRSSGGGGVFVGGGSGPHHK
jgi:uncharacterized membrane protein